MFEVFSEEELNSFGVYLERYGMLAPSKAGAGPRVHHDVSEEELFMFSGMFYTLVPVLNKTLSKYPISAPNRIKALIETYHLELGLNPEITVDYTYSILRNLIKYKKYGQKYKFGIHNVKTKHSQIYQQLMEVQNSRCATCGLVFDDTQAPELDHVIPYALGGDVVDGSNWQLLCNDCNGGKGTLLTMTQHRYSRGWIYGLAGHLTEEQTPSISNRIRYCVLKRDRGCLVCSSSPQEKSLEVCKVRESGLRIPSNLQSLCNDCK